MKKGSSRGVALLAAVIGACGALAGCNTGSGSSTGSGIFNVSSTQMVNGMAGQTVTLTGTAQTAGQSVASASWTQISGPAATLSNANCAQSSKSNLSSAGSASAPSGAQLGNYVCPLTVQLPASGTTAQYQFKFTATDSNGNTQSSISTINASATQAAPLSATVAPNANLYPGQTYKGACQTVGGIFTSAQQQPVYQWSITGPSGVTPPALTASGPQVTLTAPYLPNQTNFSLVCQASDGAGNTATGSASLTVYGTSALPPMTVNAGAAQVVNTASTVNLSATVSGASGPVTAPLYYYWKQTGGTHTVTIANANTANASFVAPGAPSAPSSGGSAPAPTVYDTQTFTVYVSYQPIDPANLSGIPASQQAQTVVTVIQQ